MKRTRITDTCPTCGGRKAPGTTTFTVELGFGVLVVRDVPADVCSQCGADWIADDTAAQIEALVDGARAHRSTVEVTTLSAVAVAETGSAYKVRE